MKSKDILAFTDGACSGNPGPGGWGSVLIIENSSSPELIIKELGGAEIKTTNNRMELMAAIQTLAELENTPGKVILSTDSKYVIEGITNWIHGWRKRGWKTKEGTPVSHQELWELLDDWVSRRKSIGGVEWTYVGGHRGIPGNEKADEIAVAFSQGNPPTLYSGPISNYSITQDELLNLKPRHEKLKSHSKKSTGPAYSYVSRVGREVLVHKTWAECEARVKGQSGALYRKALSPDDEAELIRQWKK